MDDASFTATGPAGRIEAKGGVSRVESATGLSGAAARLSSGDTLEYPVKDVFGEDRGAVAFWMKPGFDAGSSFGLWKWESGGKTTMEFFKGSSPRLYFRMRGPEKREVTFTLPDDFDYDAWHHVVLGWDKDYGDDGRVAMWVDGELGSTGGWKVDGLEQMAATMSFSGPMTIDQLQGFDQILSSEEAAALAAAKPSVSGGPGGPAAAGDNLQEQDNPALLGDGSGGEQKKQSMTAMLLGEEQAKRVQQLEDRQSQWTVLPRVDLQPGYTQSARETFTLDMGAVGRRNVEDVAWKLNGQPLPESTWSIDGGTLTLTPDRDLREGLNLFEISYEHPQAPGEAGERIRFEFPVNHQTGGSRVHYREDGAVVVDGEALFAVGGFRSGQTDDYTDALPTAAAAGLDFVHAYANDRVRDIKEAGLEEHIEKVRGYLRAAHENGLGVLLALPREAITEYDEPILTRWIAELSGEPGLWFWYLYDEPDPRHVPPASTGAASELVKRLDPHHPLVVVCNRESGTLIYGPPGRRRLARPLPGHGHRPGDGLAVAGVRRHGSQPRDGRPGQADDPGASDPRQPLDPLAAEVQPRAGDAQRRGPPADGGRGPGDVAPGAGLGRQDALVLLGPELLVLAQGGRVRALEELREDGEGVRGAGGGPSCRRAGGAAAAGARPHAEGERLVAGARRPAVDRPGEPRHLRARGGSPARPRLRGARGLERQRARRRRAGHGRPRRRADRQGPAARRRESFAMTVAADTSSMAEVLDRGRSLRIELSAGERWWGGRVVDGHHGPYGDRPFEADLGSCGGNQVAALLCSNRGRVLHSATPFRVRFDGADTLEASLGDEVATLRPDAEVTLVAAGENLRDAFGYARSEVFEPDGETPAELMFTAPQYALWIEQMYVPTQEGVLRYADALLEAGFPPGVLIIDDGWSVGYGEPVFRLDRFPDPDAMVAWLHERGFKLMLWVCPLVGPNGMPFLDLQKRGLLLRDADGETIVRRWWNGHAAVFDMTSRESVEAFLNPLRVLRERHGIDGFKMDAGDTRQYRIGDAAALPGALPADQAHAFAKLGLEFSYAEVKAGFNNGGLGVAVTPPRQAPRLDRRDGRQRDRPPRARGVDDRHALLRAGT